MIKSYANANERLSAHFRAGEFRCKCCGKIRIDSTLIGFLEQLYAALNCSKIIVSSGYRCTRHDRRSEERRVGKECRSRWSP